jgi:hypothetical protein
VHDRRVHLRLEQRVAVLAEMLCPVHGGVCTAQEIVGLVASGVAERDAEARVDAHLLAL